jgi:hypothetical protein
MHLDNAAAAARTAGITVQVGIPDRRRELEGPAPKLAMRAPRVQSTATQSISTSNGPGQDGTCTKIRAGESSAKYRS